MRWRDSRRSDNIEDRRGQGLPGGGMGFPGGGGMRRAGVGGGFGLLVVFVLALLFGVDPSQLLQPGGPLDTGSYAPESPSGPSSEADPELRDFVSAVLGETEDTWRAQFQQMGQSYRDPSLVLFNGAVQSACGFAQSAMGPF
jgi:hypothetical protein